MPPSLCLPVLLTVVWLSLLPPPVAAYLSCSWAESIAANYLDQLAQGWCGPRSQCGVGSRGVDNCIEGSDPLVKLYNDGCAYTAGNYTVQRQVAASIRTDNSYGYTMYPHSLSYTHWFTAGAEGKIFFFFGSASSTELVPYYGGYCSFQFNDNQCSCVVKFCDDSQTTVREYIDCSDVEGGGVIDGCQALPTLTNESSLFEILVGAPYCSGDVPYMAPDGGQETTPSPFTSPETPAPDGVQETTPSQDSFIETATPGGVQALTLSPVTSPETLVNEPGPVMEEDPPASVCSPKMAAGRCSMIIIVIGMTLF